VRVKLVKNEMTAKINF